MVPKSNYEDLKEIKNLDKVSSEQSEGMADDESESLSQSDSEAEKSLARFPARKQSLTVEQKRKQELANQKAQVEYEKAFNKFKNLGGSFFRQP